MGALERLQDLLERIQTPDGWRPTNEADRIIRALAPVIASDLIALAEAAGEVGDVLVANPKCPYCWVKDRGHLEDCPLSKLHDALSTVLAHIDDSLVIEGEGEGQHKLAPNGARPSVETAPPSLICPVCSTAGSLVKRPWFDEEGVEAWECDECGTGWIKGWEEPPTADDEPSRPAERTSATEGGTQ